jgi:beta-galactosidase/beta-glucuronidase
MNPLAISLALLASLTISASAATDHVVCRIDTSHEAAAQAFMPCEVYHFTAATVPHDLKDRDVLFAKPLQAAFAGLAPGADYAVRMTFLSDVPRIESISANETVLEPAFHLPPGKTVVKQWPILATALVDGTLYLTIDSPSGPDPVVQTIEILSSNPTNLHPATLPIPPLELPRLTPRPVAVSAIDQLQVNLEGEWQFNPTPPEDFGLKPAPPGAMGWHTIQVPAEWVMQGFNVPRNGWAGYYRTVKVPADWAGRRIKLKCDAIYSQGQVFVNGREAGITHEGGFTPSEMDLTGLIKPGEVNSVAVKVRNDTIADTLSFMSTYAQHPLGGITRKIYLFAVPEMNISRLLVTTAFDKDYLNAVLTVKATVTNESSRDADEASLALRLSDPSGRDVPITLSKFKLPALKAGATAEQELLIPVTAPLKWDPEHPHLYSLSVDLRQGQITTEMLKQHIGFRQVELQGNQLFVNGSPIKLRGVERHEMDPHAGRVNTIEEWREDVQRMRECNMNFVFTCHYPDPEEFLDLCDENGLFVASEFPFVWVNPKQANDPTLTSHFIVPALAALEHNYNHPSIIYWQIGDECTWGRNFAIMQRLVQQADPTRTTCFSWESNTASIVSKHYPELDHPATHASDAKPFIYDQYAHINCYNRREILTDPGLRDYYGEAIAPFYDAMVASKACLGGAIWSWIDDLFYLHPDQKQYNGIPDPDTGMILAGYGEWGLVDRWRRVKPEFWQVKKAYSPIHIEEQTLTRRANDASLEIPVENRFDFTNLDEIKIEWTLGKATGTVTASIAPHSKGAIELHPGGEAMRAAELDLNFTDAHGMLLDAYRFPLADAGSLSRTYSVPPLAPSKPDLMQDDKSIIVHAGRIRWIVNRKSGMIDSVKIGNSTHLFAGPVLGVTPLEPVVGGQITRVPTELQPDYGSWKASRVEAKELPDAVEVIASGQQAESPGQYTLRFDAAGGLLVDYHFTHAGKPIDPREIGMTFDIDRSWDLLKWDRLAQWSEYPGGSIGRPKGSATALRRDADWPPAKPGERPPWPWELDSTPGGTNDFRSTKRNILSASLSGADGAGVAMESDGKQHIRCWLAGDRVRFLAATGSAGVGDGFLRSHFKAVQLPVIASHTSLDGEVRLQIVQKPDSN